MSLPPLVVADTHALVWFAQDQPRRLGRVGREVLRRAEQGLAGVYVSTLSVVEIFEAEARGRIRFPLGALAWCDALFAAPGFFPADVTLDVVRRAHALGSIPERADRLIAATAASLGVPLLTRDPGIAAAAGVAVVW